MVLFAHQQLQSIPPATVDAPFDPTRATPPRVDTVGPMTRIGVTILS